MEYIMFMADGVAHGAEIAAFFFNIYPHVGFPLKKQHCRLASTY